MGDKVIPVRVAIRIRPLNSKELTEGAQKCVNKILGQPQVTVGATDAYTYDYVFAENDSQNAVYDVAVTKIVNKIFKGYNVTILAYGQTGSGKTFTMGTADTSSSLVSVNSGIIQRAVKDLFIKMAEDDSHVTYETTVSFLELYMEKVYDLLSKTRNEEVEIREDAKGIKINGLTEAPVKSCEETLRCLEQGSHNRRTGATAMNNVSSRSHAVFTLTISQISKDTNTVVKISKFHLVDLAGSERASKTLAVGERFNEGVNINKGLLALGNVISALCESTARHIPYRDSKLTRLLQDSLGGNSHTLMIACVSPADSNYEETISTLRYADRARKIKNKPIVNQDPNAAELQALRTQVQQLLAAGRGENFNSAELEELRQQLKFSEEEKVKFMHALQASLEENMLLSEKAIIADQSNQQLKQRLEELQAQAQQTLGAMNQTLNETKELDVNKTIEQVTSLKSKIEEIQDVQRKGEIDQVYHDMQQETEDKENVDTGKNSDEDMAIKSPARMSKEGADMTLRQAALSHNLKELNAELARKVHMVNKMNQDQGQYSSTKAHYEAALSELEKQVVALQQEKEELANLLTQASSNINACKISEQRRKRLQELEPQINELKKKISDQANIIKLKNRAEEQLKKFNVDIQNIRAQKVKLVRQMREDSEKFRTWRQQKEREVARLKDMDRKRQGQLQKMEVLHTKQQNVLRRKMDDAMAVSRRLKEALALHGNKVSGKSSSQSTGPENEQRIKNWLKSELDLLDKTKEAELTLESLMESRKMLAAQQTKLQAKLEAPDNSPTFIDSLQKELAGVSADMDLRSKQIMELKQKIDCADLEAKAKLRMEYLQTMVEAKIALKGLFDECILARGEAFRYSSEVQDLRSDLDDLQRQYDEVVHEATNHDEEILQLKKKHHVELSKQGRDYDETLLLLMRQLPQPNGIKDSADHKVSEEDIMQRLKLQQQELERCCTLQQQLNAALNEIERLKQQGASFCSPELKPPPVPKPKAKKPKESGKLKPASAAFSPSSDEDDDEYNSDEDPEWRNTPMAKRIRKLKEDDVHPIPKLPELDINKVGKRMSRSHCQCRTGGCRNCICSRDNRPCSKDCGCSATGTCKNAATVEESSDVQNHMLNETFDLGRKKSRDSSKENSHNGEDVDDDELPMKKSRMGPPNVPKKNYFD